MLLVAFPGTPRKTANCPQHRRESEQRTLPWTGRRPTARLDFRRGSRGKRHFVCMSYRCPFPGRQDVALPPAPHALHGYPLRTPHLASSAQYFLLDFIQFRMWVGGASHPHVRPASRKGPRGPQAGEGRHEPRGGRLQRGSCRRGKDLDFCSRGTSDQSPARDTQFRPRHPLAGPPPTRRGTAGPVPLLWALPPQMHREMALPSSCGAG